MLLTQSSPSRTPYLKPIYISVCSCLYHPGNAARCLMPLADDLSPSGNARLLYDLRAVRHINVIPTILPTPPATLATAGTTAGGVVTTLAPAAATAVSKGARATFVPLHALVPHTPSQ